MKEEEIRPQKLFDEFLRLAEKDTAVFFSDTPCENKPCPACNKTGEFAFAKHGFTYEICPSCETLFVNPRPEVEAFAKYYQEAESTKYWATAFYKETAEARRKKLWLPKVHKILEIMKRYSANDHKLIDIGGGYGLFACEMEKVSGKPALVIEPNPHMAKECRGKSLHVIEKFLENIVQDDLPSSAKTFVSFELFEHLHNPAIFLDHLLKLMNKGDLFIFTTLSGTGLDIQILWENSKSVSPPHHLNFFNPNSVKIILEKSGFELLEVTTPGKLDIDILVKNRRFIKDHFWRSFTAAASETTKEQWQNLIASTGLSSHMMAVCRKI